MIVLNPKTTEKTERVSKNLKFPKELYDLINKNKGYQDFATAVYTLCDQAIRDNKYREEAIKKAICNIDK